jgi:catechol 2,3-dioxygenase-like lactoylglutathione lyase family enzyme
MSERTHNLVTILPCNDVAKSLAFYSRLGFRLALGDEEYAMLEDDRGAQIHLQPAVAGWLIPGRNPFGLYLYTEQVDSLAREFASEILNAAGPEDKPWGMYEFALSDPDETLVRIGWPTRLRTGNTA